MFSGKIKKEMDYSQLPDGSYLNQLMQSELKKIDELNEKFLHFIKESDFLKKFPIRHFKKNNYILRNFKHKGYHQKTLAFLHKGLAKGIIDRSSTIVTRRPAVIFMGSGKWLGLDSYGGYANMFSFVSLANCEVSLVPLDWVLEEAPTYVWQHTFKQCSYDLQLINSAGATFKVYSLKQRIMQGICIISDMIDSLDLTISRTDMAQYIGIERQYLSKILKELEAENLVSFKKKTVSIIDINKFLSAFFDAGDC